MKCHKTFHTLVSGIILPLLLIAFPVIPAYAAGGDGLIVPDPDRGKVGDRIEVDGYDLAAGQVIRFYFSSDKAEAGDYIDEEVTTYQRLTGEAATDTSGDFGAPYHFTVPGELTDGKDEEEVRGGDYYIYAVYLGSKHIRAVAEFTVAGPLVLDSDEGRIGDSIEIDGYGFKADQIINIAFSSDKADEGDYIDDEVTAYEHLGVATINSDGDFTTPRYFTIPTELTHGKDKEDVHGGDYYVYATYYLGTKRIEAVARFVVIAGEIELNPDEGQVGNEVEISGEGLRNNQEVTIKYDGNVIGIASGDDETDSEGKFSGTIIIPESTAGSHVITVTDESGNRPRAVFSVQPKITIDPLSAAEGNTVKVSGAGFGEREYITITFTDLDILTTPESIRTDYLGSFDSSFIIPFSPVYGSGDTGKVAASDSSLNTAEAQLTIIAGSANISLRPPTSLTSPGHVGMELTADGTGFIASATVTITYSNGEAMTIATTTTDANGNFSATFTAPPSLAGEHAVTATDSTNSITAVFTMESAAPPTPVPVLRELVIATEAEAYFDWEDVEDTSGVTYSLQVASDTDFTKIVLEKSGLTDSEYSTTKEERLELIKKEKPYHWRVKAVDGAANESEWTSGGLLYVGFSQTWIPDWALGIGICIVIGFVGLLLCIVGLRGEGGTAK